MPLDQAQVLAALRSVKDPELHKDIVTLGMVKNVEVNDTTVRVGVELTTPACPLKEVIERDVKNALANIGATQVHVELTASTRGPSPAAGGQRRDILP